MSQLPVLAPSLRQKINDAAGRAVSPIQFVLGRFLIFDDGVNIYAYSWNLERAWTIKKRSKLHGWAVHASDIYVQDGPVLCQYTITALMSDADPVPANAVNVSTSANWTAQPQSDQTLASLFTATTLTFSAPAVWSSSLNSAAVAGLASNGKIQALPANLLPGNATTSGPSPTLPARICGVQQGDHLYLRYLSGGHVMNYRVFNLDQAPDSQSNLPPEAGDAHWRALHRIAAARGGEPSQEWIELAPSSLPAIAVTSALPADDGVVVCDGRDLVRCARSGATRGISLKNMPAGPPVRFVDPGAEWFYSLTAETDGTVFLEQYKLASAVEGTAQNLWPVMTSQLAGVGPWVAGQLPPPFDENSTIVCYAAAQEALGKSNAGIADRLAAAVPAAAASMIKIAANSNLVDETARALLRLGTVPRDIMFGILMAVNHPPEKIGPLMQQFYDAERTDGEWLAKALTAKQCTRLQTAAAMYEAGYPVCPLIVGVDLKAAELHYWLNGYPLPEVGPQGTEFATAIRKAGYLSADVAKSCKDLPSALNHRIFVAASIFKGGYPLMTALDALRDIVFAGHDFRNSALYVGVVYHTDLAKIDPSKLDPNFPQV